MGSTFDRDTRKALRRIQRDENAVKDALTHCREGKFFPEFEETHGIVELLDFLGYNPNADPTFDAERVYELQHDFGVDNPIRQAQMWIRMALRLPTENGEPFCAAVQDNMQEALELLGEGDNIGPNAVLLIYSFADGAEPYTHIIAKDDEAAARMRVIFPQSAVGWTTDNTFCQLTIGQAGEKSRNQLVSRMPDNWVYEDNRFERDKENC